MHFLKSVREGIKINDLVFQGKNLIGFFLKNSCNFSF